ncbi:MAG: VWA domain-containing protein [Verrucomicrobiae bacterium]|nr:VWA domain-containing protein [Verrucomicrobiae bacterium]MCX7722053.1 VWA domain-containing protein [Verrucomicrobiae bacterium]
MTFGRPYLLLLLALVPLIAWLKGRAGLQPAVIYSAVGFFKGMARHARSRAGRILFALRWLTLCVLVLACSQPRLIKPGATVKASGVDIVIALDLSGSMESEDFVVAGQRVNRLEMAKRVLRTFIRNRPNDRIGLVAFAAQPYIGAPLTLDHDFLQQCIERLEIGIIDETRTAIGSGLATAVNRLRDRKAKSRIVILMTDGQNNAGKISPLTAAELAQALGIKVYTVGVGTRGVAPMPVKVRGQKVGYRPVEVDIDEDTLREIARLTGGKYYRADNAERFQEIYAEIDRLEKTEAEVKKFAEYKELFPWFVGVGLALLLIEIVLGNTVWRRLP